MASERQQHQWHPQAGQDQGQMEKGRTGQPQAAGPQPPLLTVPPAPATTRVSSCSAAPNSQASP
eukprot:7731197-Pyramimonas_sp.AAC.1